MRRMKAIVRAVWLRGFLPALIVLASAIVASGVSICWQGKGVIPTRVSMVRGVVLVSWHDPAKPPMADRGIGGVKWYASVVYDKSGNRKTGFMAVRPLWKPGRASLDWNLEIQPGHVKVPLFPLAGVLLVPPVIFLLWRRMFPKYALWECAGCGYDLRGADGAVCPECGRRRVGARTPHPDEMSGRIEREHRPHERS